ncbi:uncharacterized protein LY79DRAFT_211422 [Colletotrichum navitas]|uniref:Uncharacterized protein n=1 Tax=Colletotrichum navitas TaxID=681940 RepID=A0AAD8VAJ5_9PEZI|nr:uncharacterized protein LY79DRAFT_211422 [Colletotrichum navitas]KAK1599179.1 hypothetical protein LY79DRAFT_211422 [Colletotrichum navitas]
MAAQSSEPDRLSRSLSVTLTPTKMDPHLVRRQSRGRKRSHVLPPPHPRPSSRSITSTTAARATSRSANSSASSSSLLVYQYIHMKTRDRLIVHTPRAVLHLPSRVMPNNIALIVYLIHEVPSSLDTARALNLDIIFISECQAKPVTVKHVLRGLAGFRLRTVLDEVNIVTFIFIASDRVIKASQKGPSWAFFMYHVQQEGVFPMPSMAENTRGFHTDVIT